MSEADEKQGSLRNVLNEIPIGPLKKAGQELVEALVSRAVGSVSNKVTGLTDRLTDVAEGGGTGLMSAVTGKQGTQDETGGVSKLTAGLRGGAGKVQDKVKEAVSGASGGEGGGGGSSGSNAKVVNIIEEANVGLPLRVAYNQWTQFADYPSFTRKVESADQESDEKINWRARIFFSHRSWQSTITEQVPDDHIVWTSTGSKGSVDGTVTFHDLGSTMTKIVLVLEYHPQGFFEKTANLWRAQGRRVRSDFKHIKRHMMTRTILEQDEVEGWRGEIRDREVVQTHEEALQNEQSRTGDEDSDYGDSDEYEDEEYYDEGDEQSRASDEDSRYGESEEDGAAEYEVGDEQSRSDRRERVRAGRRR